MSDRSSLAGVIESAIMNWCDENGGGYPVGFLGIVDYIDGNGKCRLGVAKLSDQPTHRSFGLASYLKAWYEDDCQRTWARNFDDDEDDDE